MELNGIELTDAQKVQLEAIQKKYQPEMMAIRNDMMNGGDRAELMKKAADLRDKSAKDIRAILTPGSAGRVRQEPRRAEAAGARMRQALSAMDGRRGGASPWLMRPRDAVH